MRHDHTENFDSVKKKIGTISDKITSSEDDFTILCHQARCGHLSLSEA